MCDSPYTAIEKGQIKGGKLWPFDVEVPCGKCPVCKQRRVSDWVIRLKKEELESSSSYFVTLTYDPEHEIINELLTENNFLSLRPRHLELFWKRLRKINESKIKYYACGEYGGMGDRPHYHAIIFNCDDMDNLFKAWQYGHIHVGKVTGNSIAYTCKYIDKGKTVPKHARDDREKEFSRMSQKLGHAYIEKNKKWHLDDITRMYINHKGDYYILPRYYRERIYNEKQRREQLKLIQNNQFQDLEEKRKLFKNLHNTEENITFEQWIYTHKEGRWTRFNKNNKSKKRWLKSELEQKEIMTGKRIQHSLKQIARQ